MHAHRGRAVVMLKDNILRPRLFEKGKAILPAYDLRAADVTQARFFQALVHGALLRHVGDVGIGGSRHAEIVGQPRAGDDALLAARNDKQRVKRLDLAERHGIIRVLFDDRDRVFDVRILDLAFLIQRSFRVAVGSFRVAVGKIGFQDHGLAAQGADILQVVECGGCGLDHNNFIFHSRLR